VVRVRLVKLLFAYGAPRNDAGLRAAADAVLTVESTTCAADLTARRSTVARSAIHVFGLLLEVGPCKRRGRSSSWLGTALALVVPGHSAPTVPKRAWIRLFHSA
jgi:hypothetical protein